MNKELMECHGCGEMSDPDALNALDMGDYCEMCTDMLTDAGEED